MTELKFSECRDFVERVCSPSFTTTVIDGASKTKIDVWFNEYNKFVESTDKTMTARVERMHQYIGQMYYYLLGTRSAEPSTLQFQLDERSREVSDFYQYLAHKVGGIWVQICLLKLTAPFNLDSLETTVK